MTTNGAHPSEQASKHKQASLVEKGNRLLAVIGEEARERFHAKIERVELKQKQVLYRPDERITEIYFPDDCVLAMLTIMENGATIESATVGREGASWLSASFRSPTMPCQTLVTVPGNALKLPSSIVENEIRQNGKFHDAISHYAHVLLIQTLRSTACNGLHTLEQRCCRWILTTLDRTDVDHFVITHEFLAALLGVRRTSVSELVERLVEQGVLQSERGWIRVADREKMKRLSCECYEVMRKQFTKSF